MFYKGNFPILICSQNTLKSFPGKNKTLCFLSIPSAIVHVSLLLSTSCDCLMMVASPVKHLLTHITFETCLGLILTQIHWLTHTLTNAATSDPDELNYITQFLSDHTHACSQTQCNYARKKKCFGVGWGPTGYNVSVYWNCSKSARYFSCQHWNKATTQCITGCKYLTSQRTSHFSFSLYPSVGK